MQVSLAIEWAARPILPNDNIPTESGRSILLNELDLFNTQCRFVHWLAISGNLAFAKSLLKIKQYDKGHFLFGYMQRCLVSVNNADFSCINKESLEKLSLDLNK